MKKIRPKKALNHTYQDSEEFEEIEEKSLTGEDYVEEYLLADHSTEGSIQNES